MGLSFILIITTVITALKLIFAMVSIKPQSDREKYSTFECGMDLMNHPRPPFSLNFYFITIIFLIFDIELMMILPMVFCMKITKLKLMSTMIMALFVVLVVSFIYEWLVGFMSWMI